ncbi:hypothetical protein Ana3638_02475 [Anaerocolumna sedimenticola]|uniref:Uncharacterized protein n=1 Tax=Anaerocolumna sedimenticola TaxID=2696063 RepID=A0A6P1TF45_9FIRM|nr:hypothetical protein [Anaerocolumna sedimenticola]QHQ59810.1 hypothetical protein Ana3638_02475 [Anaerocolumna sedimenticola]
MSNVNTLLEIAISEISSKEGIFKGCLKHLVDTGMLEHVSRGVAIFYERKEIRICRFYQKHLKDMKKRKRTT